MLDDQCSPIFLISHFWTVILSYKNCLCSKHFDCHGRNTRLLVALYHRSYDYTLSIWVYLRSVNVYLQFYHFSIPMYEDSFVGARTRLSCRVNIMVTYWPGAAIRSHGIDLIFVTYSGFNLIRISPQDVMMTSSNGSIFRVAGPLCGEFPDHRWIPLTKASDAELWCFLWTASEQTVE